MQRLQTAKPQSSRCNLQSSAGAYIGSEPDPQQIFFTQTKNIYASIGYQLDLYLDFEDGFCIDVFHQALSKPFIHLSGGNTFRFLNAMNQRNVANALINYTAQGGVLIGVSAGAMLLTPSIITANLCGDPNDVGIENLQALNLTSFLFAPHSDKQLKNHRAFHDKQTLYMASDDDAVLITNKTLITIGSPLKVTPGSTPHI